MLTFIALLAQFDPFADALPGSSAGRPSGARPYDDFSGTSNTLPNPLGIYDLNDFLNKIFEALTIIAVPIVTAMVLWGAFKIITSAGDPGKVKEGWRAILWASVGFGLLLLANGAVDILKSLLQ